MASKLTREEVSTWTSEKVAAFLEEEGVSDGVLRLFKEKEVIGKAFLAMTEEKLEAMGVKSKGIRRFIVRILGDFEATQGALQRQPGGPDPSFGLCKAHSFPFEYFCEQCDVLICAKCVAEKHEGHKRSSATEKAGVLKDELALFRWQLERQVGHTERVLGECGSALERLETETKRSIAAIEATKKQVVREIERATDAAITKVQELHAAKVGALQSKIEQNTQLKKELEAHEQELSHHLGTSSDGVIMQLRDPLKATSKDLLGEKKARSIAKLDEVRHVKVQIDEAKTLQAIKDLANKNLFTVEENGEVASRGVGCELEVRYVVALGGQTEWNAGYLDTAELFDSKTEKWTPLPPMAEKRGFCPAVGVHEDKVYVAGGAIEDNKPTDSFEVLDLATKKWKRMPPMRTKRDRTSGVFLPKEMRFLVIGGWNGVSLVSSCEAFDVASDKWVDVASLSGNRHVHCCVLYKGKAVVLGGSSGGGNYLGTCEQYDASSDKWAPFPPFNTARGWYGVAVFEDKIYIAGGYDGKTSFDSMEVFDGTRWSTISATLTVPRSEHALLALGGKIVVLGGDEEHTEVFDPATNTVAKDVFPKMVNVKRRKLGAVCF